ncbi:hypothetical protein DICPUDRAFT_159161 [Dictyostelium purpureum]|uniref:Dolichyl-diphosphooligosaccharide--protein glycosyltransferase subunit KCP2 n=1 Tax=Dictyostelium purpureum TaxID=5786 RepID=F1A3F5_DICPU|nr:uncharacterized protein DICPUDRAFT_159161 [Dictyostelium purpureum]EGC29276.1 hypothetical protein DICPUDRAFT_159161 [Dictyostelium purpureum]|eukprot:XP_003294198.1 hypothetical protein DICPUDRAFT_159161 [Dictyostelium purpureum]
MQTNYLLSILLVLCTLLSFAYASGSTSNSTGLVGGILFTAFGLSIFSRLIQRIAPNFVFSLLPYHSVSC